MTAHVIVGQNADALTLSFPQPCKLLSLNDRLHHIERYKMEKHWHTAAWAAAINAVGKHGVTRRRPRSVVTVGLPVRSTKVRRDPHNFVATVKPVIDGLVDAGFWPDDTPEWVVTTEPTFHRGHLATVTLRPAEPYVTEVT